MSNLQLDYPTGLNQSDKTEIQQLINATAIMQTQSTSEVTKLVMDSVVCLTTSEAKAKELAEQGFLDRFWGRLTGKNRVLDAEIKVNLAKSQFASQQLIQKLAEENKLSFDMIVAINNKLNTLSLETDREINEIYDTLKVYFKKVCSKILKLETRLDKLERDVQLLHWKSTIGYHSYNGIDYCELPELEKIICVVNDFYTISKGNWSTDELMVFFKATLAEVGIDVKKTVSYNDFFLYLSEKPELINRLFEDIQIDNIINAEIFHVPVLKGVDKLLQLDGEEKYLVDTVGQQLEVANLVVQPTQIKASLVSQYLKNQAFTTTTKEIQVFDFAVELLVNLNIVANNKNTPLEPISPRVASAEVEPSEQCPKSFIEVSGEWVYYINKADNHSIYKCKKDGSEKTKINNVPSGCLNLIGDSIYYIKANSVDLSRPLHHIKGELRKVNLVDASDNVLFDEKAISSLNHYGDTLFFCSGKNICSINIPEDNFRIITTTEDSPQCLNIIDHWIYYIDNFGEKICRIATEGSTQEVVYISNNKNLNNLIIYSEYLYFTRNKDLVKTDLTGNNPIILSKNKNHSYLYPSNGYIYFIEDVIASKHSYRTICKVDTQGNSDNLVSFEETYAFAISNNKVFFINSRKGVEGALSSVLSNYLLL
ncbi:hypothetical protein GGQ84_000736 [Desulfitispora alkaliphila]|uniref:DUF5050 domain-containing protein n=1 Tax=Desulfitispora alkaliphila TaxID=622674 RepID=UPI003D1FC5D3